MGFWDVDAMLLEMSFVQYREWLDFFERRNQAMEEAQRGLPGHEGPPSPPRKQREKENGVNLGLRILGSLQAYSKEQKAGAGIPPGFRPLGLPG